MGASPLGQAAEWRKCDMSAADIAQVLEERQVGELSRLLYVATPSLNVSQARCLPPLPTAKRAPRAASHGEPLLTNLPRSTARRLRRCTSSASP